MLTFKFAPSVNRLLLITFFLHLLGSDRVWAETVFSKNVSEINKNILKEDYISSKEYLNTLIENYPNGKYFNEANKYRDWRKLAQRKIDEINNPTKYEK